MDGRLYLGVNHFAKDTPALHGFMVLFASYLGLGLIGLLSLFALVRALRADSGARPRLLLGWASAGAAVAIGYGLERAIGRTPPFVGRPGVEVLVARSLAPSLPNLRTAIAAALVLALFISRRWILAGISTLLAALLGYGCVYIGAAYPGDVLAGAGLGIAVLLLVYGTVALLASVSPQRLETVPGSITHASARPMGIAATPSVIESPSSVRLLSDAPIRPQEPRVASNH